MFLEQSRRNASDDGRFYLWLYADIIRAVKTVIDRTMYRLHLQSFAAAADLRSLAGLADGIICYDMADPRLIAAIGRLKTPFIVCGQGEPQDASYNCCFIDERAGGRSAGKYLRDLGHTRPAHITGCLDTVDVCRLRWEGFRSAFDSPPLLVDQGLGIAAGHAAASGLVERIRRKEIDCIFVVNDLTAVGVVQALLAHNIRIPQDVSVVGYDNLPFIQTLPVRLTTIDIGLGRAYGEAATLLLDTMKSGGKVHHPVCPQLVPGESALDRRSGM